MVPISDLSFLTIRRNMERMTDAQWEDYKREITGKRVSWSGWVEDVKEKFFGGYSLLIDMDPPHDEFSVQDITFDDISESFAKRLNKDDRVSFTGTISMVAGIMGSCQVSLDDIGPPKGSEQPPPKKKRTFEQCVAACQESAPKDDWFADGRCLASCR